MLKKSLNDHAGFAKIIAVAAIIAVTAFIKANVSSEPGLGKGIRYGMRQVKVEDKLCKYLPAFTCMGKGCVGIPRSNQTDEFEDYYGEEISSCVDQVVYSFEDDKLNKVKYMITQDAFDDMESACEAFGIDYNEKHDEGNGYYSFYTKDDVYIELHPYSSSAYKDKYDEYYIYYEPAYEQGFPGRLGHKHEWEIECGKKKVCKECGKKRTSNRYHVVDGCGFCEICDENVGIPLSDANMANYITMNVSGHGGQDKDGCYIDYTISVSPIGDYDFENAKFLVFCDRKYDYSPEDNVRDAYLGSISVDSTGHGELSDRIYVNVLENFRLRCDNGRTYINRQDDTKDRINDFLALWDY